MIAYEVEDVIQDLVIEVQTLIETDPKNAQYLRADLLQALTIMAVSYETDREEYADWDIIGWLCHVLPNNRVVTGWAENCERPAPIASEILSILDL